MHCYTGGLVVIRLAFAAILSFLFTFYLIPIITRLAYTLNILDCPDEKIKVHEQPVPYLGGVSVYLGFIISLAFVMPFENTFLLLILGGTLLLFLGLIDDLIRLKPYQKFAGQLLAVFCFLKSGIYLKEHFFVRNPLLNISISIFWILGSVNSINLVDVMDGLSTTISIMATLGFFIISLLLQQYTIALFLAAFLGALCAFLWYNYPPAKVYLGDAGALFIGGILGGIPLLINWGTYSSSGYLAPVAVLAIPPLEVAMLMIIRTAKGIPFYQPSSDHFCMYLLRYGYTKKQVLCGVVIVSLCFLGTAFGILFSQTSFHISISVSSLCLIGLFVLRLVYYPHYFQHYPQELLRE